MAGLIRNLEEIRWGRLPGIGTGTRPEQDELWEQVGVAVRYLEPGETVAVYHRENDQEDFLVLSGAGTLIVEGEERPLRQWDFFHCPPWTEHTILGAGDGPSLVLATSLRGQEGARYPVNEAAVRHTAGVEEGMTPREAYARFGELQEGPAPELPR